MNGEYSMHLVHVKYKVQDQSDLLLSLVRYAQIGRCIPPVMGVYFNR